MSDFSKSYEEVAPYVYGFVCLAVLLASGAWLAAHPVVFFRYLKRGAIKYLAPVVGLLLAAGAFFGLSALLSEGGSSQFQLQILLTGIITLIVAALVLPMALWQDRPREPLKLPGHLRELILFAAAAILWSVVSVSVITSFVKYEVVEQGVAGQIATGRPVEYIGFCFFAVLAAILEEIIFRGGLQGLLRRFGTPAWAAIGTTAFFFALGHVGYMRPDGIKELQIFGLAVILGYARERRGLAAAMWIHVANNLFAVIAQVFIGDTPM